MDQLFFSICKPGELKLEFALLLHIRFSFFIISCQRKREKDVATEDRWRTKKETLQRDFAPTATSLTKIRNTISCKEKLVQRIPYSLLDNVRATFPFFVAGIWTSDRHVILLSIKKFRVSHNYHRFEIFISSSHYNYIRYNIIDLESFHGHSKFYYRKTVEIKSWKISKIKKFDWLKKYINEQHRRFNRHENSYTPISLALVSFAYFFFIIVIIN